MIGNSLLLWIARVRLISVFPSAPLAEEAWLHERYGEAYEDYRRATAQFL